MLDSRWSSEAIADEICDFYTQHPYPPPVENLDRAREEWNDPKRHRAEYHLFWPEKPFRAALDILVAGCGTWQAARYALLRPESHIAGIDVSPTSIEHTERLRQKYSLTNLGVRQLPLEHAGELQRRFDLIICTGVLHHLADPEAGLRALASILKPDGAMYLMVYAPYGRAGIYMLQEYCRRLGIGTSDRDIQELIGALERLPQAHPLVSVLRGSRDARNADALADALLNPRDRSYSVPQFLDFIDQSGLQLKRWYWQAPYLPSCSAIPATSHASMIAALPVSEQYAAMELWRGTMTCHSAIVCARNGNARQVGFDDDRWLRYVPLRLPWTQLIEERLPAGAAGMLLNRSHTHPDLILPIDGQEKQWFHAIDGRRSIAEIAGPESRQRVQSLFKRLWEYDQVVFDASN